VFGFHLVGFWLALLNLADSPITRGCLHPATAAPKAMAAALPVRTIESLHLSSFHDFGLAEPITRALAEEQYVTPTAIQTQTIPIALSRRDVIGIAQTGTGKTAAFALPILHHLFTHRRRPERKSCRVLVLSPTRELSGQILDSFRAYGRHVGVSTALAIGGVSMGAQVRSLLNGVDVLVATPGRLLDLVASNALRLGDVEHLVLDEADRMLDMGFIHDIRKIVAKLPARRQTLFFSATMPGAIAELASQMLRDPAKVAVTPVSSTGDRVEQRVIRVDRAAKPAVLAKVLQQEQVERVLVFTRTKHGADKVVRGLAKAGIAASAIHGNKSQNQRTRALMAFRSGDVRTLVATDIAARGIDVDGISHVVNFDLPNVPETYVHRIGRTARAGAAGTAISLCDAEELPFLRDIEKLIRRSIPTTDDRSAPAQHHRPAAQAEAPATEKRPIAERSSRPRNGAGKQHHRDAQAASGNRHHRDGQAASGKQHHRDAQAAPGKQHHRDAQAAPGKQHHHNAHAAPGNRHRHKQIRNDPASGIAGLEFLKRRPHPGRGTDPRDVGQGDATG
jgi:ATP-dependent RNA helicase RhlE